MGQKGLEPLLCANQLVWIGSEALALKTTIELP